MSNSIRRLRRSGASSSHERYILNLMGHGLEQVPKAVAVEDPFHVTGQGSEALANHINRD
jgi:hypothetical protein